MWAVLLGSMVVDFGIDDGVVSFESDISGVFSWSFVLRLLADRAVDIGVSDAT